MERYSLTDEQVLKMPLCRFWLLSGSINRIQAEQDIRALFVTAAAQSADGVKDYCEKLKNEVGNIPRPDSKATEWVSDIPTESNREGFAQLAALAVSQ